MPRKKPVLTNRQAIDAWLATFTPAGPTAVLAASLRSMASELDNDPTQAALWGQYGRALIELRALLADEGVDDESEAVVLRLAGGVRS